MRLDWDAEYVTSYDTNGGLDTVVEVCLNGTLLAALVPPRLADPSYPGSEQEVITETVAGAFTAILEGLG